MDHRIRPMRDDGGDLEALVRLSLRAWEPVFASFAQVLGPRVFALLYPDWRAGQQTVVETICAPPAGTTVLVAEAGGVVAGFVAYGLHSPDAEQTGEIELLAVDPAHQNRGIGTALNARALAEMAAAGMRLAVAATGGDPGHAPARRSYEKAGYVGLPLVRYYKDL